MDGDGPVSAVREWFAWHSVKSHTLVPIWKRIPQRLRWDIVYRLNRSDRYCWADLVDAALYPTDGSDACDGKLPLPSGDGPACRTRCGFMPEHASHAECTCYCGKFGIEESS
jgi:hypothetical protein